MAAPKTPADRAIADVEKAIKAHDTALEKADTAQRKADELTARANRADRELNWYSRHPDLPEDFDLDEFRRSLEAPFDDEGDLPGVVDPVDELEQEKQTEADSAHDRLVAEGKVTDDTVTTIDVEAAIAQGDDEGDDDPWAGEEEQ